MLPLNQRRVADAANEQAQLGAGWSFSLGPYLLPFWENIKKSQHAQQNVVYKVYIKFTTSVELLIDRATVHPKRDGCSEAPAPELPPRATCALARTTLAVSRGCKTKKKNDVIWIMREFSIRVPG